VRPTACTWGRRISIPHPRAALSETVPSSESQVDYIAVGPIFGTSTKETGYREAGTTLVTEAAAMVRDSPRPIVAIGGITLERAPEVIRAGAASVAVISDLLSTGNPETRVKEYLRALS
jgi:thiamine-phosphate pyrophosphorylase